VRNSSFFIMTVWGCREEASLVRYLSQFVRSREERTLHAGWDRDAGCWLKHYHSRDSFSSESWRNLCDLIPEFYSWFENSRSKLHAWRLWTNRLHRPSVLRYCWLSANCLPTADAHPPTPATPALPQGWRQWHPIVHLCVRKRCPSWRDNRNRLWTPNQTPVRLSGLGGSSPFGGVSKRNAIV
jgi:hypothetical protein